MTQSSIEKTSAYISDMAAVTKIERTALFGLLRWWVEIHRESIGKDLVIETAEKYDHIIVNGKEVK